MRYTGTGYCITLAEDRPFAFVEGRGGAPVAELFTLSAVHPSSGRDDTVAVESWQAEERGEETVFSLSTQSTVWQRKRYRLQCSPGRLRYAIEVEGRAEIQEVEYFGGLCSAYPRWGSGYFSSGHRFRRGFNPEPNASDRRHFHPGSSSVIDLTGAPLPGKRHWFFTPSPFCFVFQTDAEWIGMGVESRPGANLYSEFRYCGGEAFSLRLTYDGGAAVEGRYDLPAIGFDVAGSELSALEAHVAALRRGGAVPHSTRDAAEWWSRPMFCGWGAQCALAAQRAGYRPTGDPRIDGPAFLATMRGAPAWARQDAYERFLEILLEHQLRPSTVTIDDKWQATYGANEVDPDQWPDLPGFISRRHAAGQHVLLWLKAWDPEGVPADECVRNAAGTVLAVDPTNPCFERRLRDSVRRMLSVDGYHADGFKVDFTHRIPVGPGLRLCGRERGLELLKRYLEIIHSEAKQVKPDALIVTHTPHPYLADVLDMIRLNDMLDLTRLAEPVAGADIAATVSARARVARAACPEALIDTDNWPVRDRRSWREYVRLQPSLGIPSLYFADRIDLTQEPLDDGDYALIRESWKAARWPM